VLAYRNLFWGLTDAMARTVTPWTPGFVSPNLGIRSGVPGGLEHRVDARSRRSSRTCWRAHLIYLPSHANDFRVPEVRKMLDPYVRGSNGYSAEERVKLMKLMWDAIGTEFGSRHALYERNYFGNHENIRTEVVMAGRDDGPGAEV
jgi:4-hydroxyphenylacetate 3-monooxygenase